MTISKELRHIASELTADEVSDPHDVFNTALGRLLLGLKRDADALTLRQNYKGTGSQKARRQIWIRFANGMVIDIWLDKGFVSYEGVVGFDANGRKLPPKPAQFKTEGMTPAQAYDRIRDDLRAWTALGGHTAKTASSSPVEPDDLMRLARELASSPKVGISKAWFYMDCFECGAQLDEATLEQAEAFAAKHKRHSKLYRIE